MQSPVAYELLWGSCRESFESDKDNCEVELHFGDFNRTREDYVQISERILKNDDL